MDETLKILIIIVSSALSLFLIVSIIAGVLVVKVLRDVRRITRRAEKVIESAESVREIFSANGPLFFIKIIRNIVKAAKKVMKEN